MFYTIQNNGIITAENKEALSRFYGNIRVLPEDYRDGKYLVVNNKLVLNENFTEEPEQKEQEQISRLSLTKREVFLALYKAKRVTPEKIKELIPNQEALIEFEYANEYFRGNPLIDEIGSKLGFSSEELDYLFLNGKFKEQNDD